MPRNTSIKSVLIIGSGPIVIGQACEFDYSGSQAALSLKEEGIEVSIINSNPATIMTDKVIADHVYLLPLTVESIEEILKEQKIDAVLPTMGGQTALNLCIEASNIGLWEKYDVKVIGVDVAAIEKTENREEFRQLMIDIGVGVAPSKIANSFLEGKEAAQEIGYPLVIRPSYTLAGTGGGFVHSKDEFDAALSRGLSASPTHEVLVEKAVLGWKEFELELLRDTNDNVIIICTIENFDPMGIHTGDSITVAPGMTLSDKCYQDMRNQAILMMRSIGNFAGGCNVQFSVNPEDEDIIAIEINPRVSRSSALASKATGYPIAKIAAKLAIGYNLDELQNQITKTTSAYFEPTLDYVIVKVPRFNFDKFKGANTELGLQMKAVGEVMAIGRTFIEALQKACQSLETNRAGLGADGRQLRNLEEIMHSLEHPSGDRLFHIKDAFELGVPLESIRKATRIDKWYLVQIQELVALETELRRYQLNNIPKDFFMTLKQKGYSDIQISWLLGNVTEDEVYDRRKALGISRVYKMVDTCAAEFPAQTPYYYSTFEEENESVASDKKKIVVLGSGPNRIGQGIEFDYSCVHGLLAAKEAGFEAIMVNCNPETVSTDFNMADKLYFEPVFWEHVREIIELEKPVGVIVQLGGQTALKMADQLEALGVKIIGTDFQNMDLAEDRGRFSDLLKSLDIPYPKYGVAESAEEAIKVANEVGYPVLVRPSYVLGGQGMSIVINDDDLEKAVVNLLKNLPGNRVLIDHFLDRAEEAESDSICDGEDVHIIGMMEHIEPAGIHSGDSYAVLPPFSLSQAVQDKMAEYSIKLAKALDVRGLLNIQFAVKGENVYVIEANPRASRTVPFIAKAYDVPYINIATKIMLGVNKLKDFKIERKLQGWAIKEPVFSFSKFPEVDKQLGPEMKSTGEAIRFIKDLNDPYFRDLVAKKSMFLSK
ncbi:MULTISPECIES: carbamoyl-phosphate synthase large subunit [Sphingobacterium]|uniref:carbamoyl-phosphate synthase (ammonia) n=1 Tax=Sphingobacterium kitahiroshimense TaxID=470446 RepID=A0ABV0BT11_9SPHI|nr:MULTISPECIES: carbamoyl-phosphate synthase large subunit [Sphingobacterium]MBB2952955.1 carbamoyl-phosphate synthase large subunit [Sphingobacterium sp. JUb56]MCS3555370.1 carbamoyl-phosphate synthase large subunit [Sphingobacterium sp. JUb21]MCW2261419.1 carbamoyl-phosphate synthase large subunit [Sphingobacterium kitahiroshimense]NJI76206.1 carbamoyl-phosphate synthase large subunit [Sphingobacterium sp. B16(2022)]QQD14708.1 carbamoyl-phosphate synthase large subunit [Sphingobacterium sp.